MTPQEAYEKRYAHIDNGQHTWDAAPPHVKEMWLAAWTIAWAMAESGEREACARICRDLGRWHGVAFAEFDCVEAIRARGQE